MKLLVLVSALVATAVAGPLPNGCPTNVQAVSDFDVTKYLGQWYELQRYEMIQQRGGQCVTANYAKSTNGKGDVSLVNSMVVSFDPWLEQSRTGWASLAEPAKVPLEGRLKVSFAEGVPPADYTILKTDYTGYAIVWSCKETEDKKEHEEFAWILSRTRSLTEAQKKVVDDYVNDAATVVTKALFKDTNQDEKACTKPAETTQSTTSSSPTTQAVETTTAGAVSTTASLGIVAIAALISKAIMM